MLSWVLFSMGVNPNLHDNIIREMVEFAQGIRDVVSRMGMGMVLGKFGLVFPKLTNITIYMNSNFQHKYPAKH